LHLIISSTEIFGLLQLRGIPDLAVQWLSQISASTDRPISHWVKDVQGGLCIGRIGLPLDE
jgi:hypothetical protein